jgi:tRNA-dihydrouridine synthase
VIGNGDVRTVADIERLKTHTACDGIMIGQMVSRHLARMLDFYGEERGLILFRKHAKRYLSVYPLSSEQRYRFLTTESPTELVQMLDLIVP